MSTHGLLRPGSQHSLPQVGCQEGSAESRGSFPALSFLHDLGSGRGCTDTTRCLSHVLVTFLQHFHQVLPAKALQSWAGNPPEDQNSIKTTPEMVHLCESPSKTRPCLGAWGDVSEQMPVLRLWNRPRGNLPSPLPHNLLPRKAGVPARNGPSSLIPTSAWSRFHFS